MTSPDARCSCRRLPVAGHGERPTSWLSLQDRVAVLTHHGWRAEGIGLVTQVNEDGEAMDVVGVQQDDGRVAWCTAEEVETVEVVGGIDGPDALTSIADALSSRVPIPPDGLTYFVVVGEHERVRIQVDLERAACLPQATASRTGA